MNLHKPKEWSDKPLEQLLEFVIGGDWGKDISHNEADFELAYCIRGSEIRNWKEDKGKTASLRKIKSSSIQTRRLKEGDILVEISGGGPEQPVGRTVLIDRSVLRFEPTVPKISTNFLRLIRPTSEVHSSYLNQYLQLFYSSGDIVNYQGGSNNLRNLKFPDYLKIVIPYPFDINQQEAIVTKLEELFSKLDNGVESLKTLQRQLKVYRQAVLKWAFEGKLTNSNVKDGELPNRWEWVKSGELFDFVTSGSRGWAKYYSESGALFIRITNLDFDSLNLDLSENTLQFVNPPINAEGLRTKVQEGDFLFSITGYLGMFAIAPKIDNAYINQHISLCRPKNGFNKRFVGYWIISKAGGHYHLNQLKKGATKAGLGLDDIKNFPVPIAPLEEQNLVVQEIESRLSVCDKIEETIVKGLKEAEALRQSILKQAFEGKLI